jgi:hypothetical protein
MSMSAFRDLAAQGLQLVMRLTLDYCVAGRWEASALDLIRVREDLGADSFASDSG